MMSTIFFMIRFLQTGVPLRYKDADFCYSRAHMDVHKRMHSDREELKIKVIEGGRCCWGRSERTQPASAAT